MYMWITNFKKTLVKYPFIVTGFWAYKCDCILLPFTTSISFYNFHRSINCNLVLDVFYFCPIDCSVVAYCSENQNKSLFENWKSIVMVITGHHRSFTQNCFQEIIPFSSHACQPSDRPLPLGSICIGGTLGRQRTQSVQIQTTIYPSILATYLQINQSDRQLHKH